VSEVLTKVNLIEVLAFYLGAWNTVDAEERDRLLERAVSDDVSFADPMKHLVGRAALSAHIGEVRSQYPEVLFAPDGELDQHNHFLRQAWIARIDGETLLRGVDIDDVGPDGRLTRIIGFFDTP
jgi:hypothetical protein